jgi:hypothetical protein
VRLDDFYARRRVVTNPALGRPFAKPISVAIYIHDLSPGGVERQCLVLAQELRTRGLDVVLVMHQVRGELLPLLPEGVPVVNLHSARTLQDVVRLHATQLPA